MQKPPTSARLTRCQHVHRTGSRTSATALSSALLPEVGLPGVCAASDQTQVCSLSGGATAPIHVITTRHSLPPSSSTRTRISAACARPTRTRRQRAYHVPCVYQNAVDRSFPPVVLSLRHGMAEPVNVTTYRFGSGVSARFACLNSRRLRCFTCVGHSMRPLLLPAAVLAGWLGCPQGFTPPAYAGRMPE